jgi:alanine dehydrogenase
MSSVYRPFLIEERMFEEKADLFGYLHSCEEKKIAISAVKEKIVYQALVTPIAILRK